MKNTLAILLVLSSFILVLLLQQNSVFSSNDVFKEFGTIGEAVGWQNQEIRIIPQDLAQGDEEEGDEEEIYEEEEEEWRETEEGEEEEEEFYDAIVEECEEVECEEDEMCVEGECILEYDAIVEECEEVECEEDEVCVEGECILEEEEEEEEGVECETPGDCPGENETCIDGKCEQIDECEEDGDCEKGEVCDEGKCVEMGCDEDDDCEEGMVCKEGGCKQESFTDWLKRKTGVDLSIIPNTEGKTPTELAKMPAVQQALADKGVSPQTFQNMASAFEKQGKQSAAAVAITNPLTYGTFTELIKAIVVFLRNLALVVTSLVIVMAGYYFIASEGDPAKVTKAKQMLLYALIGLLIILTSEGIIALIQKVITGK